MVVLWRVAAVAVGSRVCLGMFFDGYRVSFRSGGPVLCLLKVYSAGEIGASS